jgi:hypothetical protein
MMSNINGGSLNNIYSASSSPYSQANYKRKNSDRSNDIKDRVIDMKDIDVSVNMLTKIAEQTMITSISIDQTVDWMLLQSLVSQKWSTFKFFGIEISDTMMISKLLGLIITVLISSQLGDMLNWW